VELSDGHRLECERRFAPVAAGANDHVISKIEQDLDARAVGYG
jgi:hypothetical protein